MQTEAVFLGEKKSFTASERRRITSILSKVTDNVSQLLGAAGTVSVTFFRVDHKRVGGFTQATDWISITPTTDPIDYADLEAVLYHELHHAVRGYAGYASYKHYLLNSLFSEGLATAFEIENAPAERPATKHDKYTSALVRAWMPKMKPALFDTKNYDYAGWFHGAGRPDSLGYKIGKYLADEIRRRHPELTHKDLVRKDAKELLKLSGARF